MNERNNFAKTIFHWVTHEKMWGYGLFWAWNLIFLAFMFLGFAPNMLPQMWKALRQGLIPLDFLLLGTLLTLIPMLAVLLGLTLLRRSPGKLLALGYGVEGPLMFLLLIRLYLIRQAPLAIGVLYILSLIGVFALLWQILDRRIDEHHLSFDFVRISGLTLLFLVGVYAGVWFAFYAVPVAAQLPEMFNSLGREFWYAIIHLEWKSLIMLPFTLLGVILVCFTATLVVVAPIAVPVLYVKSWLRGLQAVASRHGRTLPVMFSLGVGLAVVALFVLANQQPQHKAYALLQQPPQTLEEANALLNQEETIRKGLLNAYLSPVRYLNAVGDVGLVQSMYEWSLHLPQKTAAKVESVYEVVARPLLYEPMAPAEESTTQNQSALSSEPQKAADLYESFFDVPIVKGERKTIVNAVRETWSGDQALAAWQGVDDREILLTRQDINITEHGDWAEVELFEAYQNQTSTRQEVVYYFSLPESAVVTGLWLGNTPDRSQRSTFHVAPRGAAQQVYREQVRVNLDPALLEQLGPRQYRLRVFPIEPQIWLWDEEGRNSTVKPGAQLYMWMTYSVLAEDNAWPLPQLAEKANVYWDKNSVRQVNGVAVAGDTEDWLAPSVAATRPVEVVAHQVTFPSVDGSPRTILLNPISAADLPNGPKNLRLAVVLDRSRSMVDQQSGVAAALAELQASNPDSDIFLTSSQYRGEQASVAKLADLVPGNILYYGGQNAADLLAQFFALNAGRRYDAVLVLTDGYGFKLGGEAVQLPQPDAPVWLIHVGGQFPLGYDDATLQVIQASGGGVAASLEEALTRLAISRQGESDPVLSRRDVVDGYEWLSIPQGGAIPSLENVIVHAPDDAFAALAARRLILDEMVRNRGRISNLETLDSLHALAVERGIVTPYSSMIVLVNERQEQRLKDLETKDNRFEREAENVGETVPAPFEVTGVPEPQEWLLIGLSVVMLAWLAWRKRLAG